MEKGFLNKYENTRECALMEYKIFMPVQKA